METFASDELNNNPEPLPSRPDFLKIICILSFVFCGIMIIIYSMGLITLFLNENTREVIWVKVIETQPQFKSLDPHEFLHAFGISCLYNLIGNVFSLIGVIMMWRFNKIGFFIYTIAELAVIFFGVNMGVGVEEKSYTTLMFVMLFDLVFIGMYAANLKYMNRKTKTITPAA